MSAPPASRATAPTGATGTNPGVGPPELVLFVSGASDLSARAIADARVLIEVHLAGRYDLLVLDLLVDLDAARAHRVLATPTLIKSEPPPERRCVGDLSDAGLVLRSLGLDAGDGRDAGVLVDVER